MTATQAVLSPGRATRALAMLFLGAFVIGSSELLIVGVLNLGDVFFGLLIFGPGLGAGTVAASIAALSGVDKRESGLASGINTAAFQVAGALGVAVVSTVAVSCAVGSGRLAALTEGFKAGFAACVVLAVAGTLLALVLLRRPWRRGPEAP